MNNVVRTIVGITAFALGIGVLVVCVKLSWDKREARQLILDAERLQQDTGGDSSLSDFLEKHRRFVHPTGDCSVSQCAYVGELTNVPLSFLRLAPPAAFYVSVLVKSDKVQEVYLSAKTTISGRPYAATIRDLSAVASNSEIKTLSSDAVLDSSGEILTSMIELGPMATPTDRRIAFDFSVECIFQVKGCADPSQITGGWPTRRKD